jgi:hypothetical protein
MLALDQDRPWSVPLVAESISTVKNAQIHRHVHCAQLILLGPAVVHVLQGILDFNVMSALSVIICNQQVSVALARRSVLYALNVQ